MKKHLLSIVFSIFFGLSIHAQDFGRIIITNANNAYPKFIVSLNGIRIDNDYNHSAVFNYADEMNYRVKILQAGSANLQKFNLNSEPRYESRYLLVQDNTGMFSLVLQSKSLILGNQVVENQEDEEVYRNQPTQIYGSKIPGAVVVGSKVPQTTTINTVTVVTVVAASTNIPPPEPVAMTNEVYNRKYNEIKGKTFDDDKLNHARNALDNEKMNVNQVIGIMKMFNFDDEKVKFAKFAYPRTIDKKEYYRTVDLITFSFTKTDLQNWINDQKK